MCKNCDDQRYYRYEVGQNHPYFGRLFPCPNCNQIVIDERCGLKTHERKIGFTSIKTIGRPSTKNMVDISRKFTTASSGFLSIHGGFGNGKTTVLMAIVNEIIAMGREARYLTASELLAYMREAFNPETRESDYDRLHELAKIPVLCIDEMDKLRDTPYSREIQQELINLRYRDAGVLGTVLAWNGDIDALPWPAVVSRISEFTVIKNTDSDMRKLLGDVK